MVGKQKIRFDMRRFLSDLGIEYWEKGKNIMKNFVGVKCWNCETEDPSHHLNLRVDGWFALCFRCGVRVIGAREVMEFVLGRSITGREFLKYLKKYRFFGEDGEGGFSSRVKEVVYEGCEEWESFGELRRVDIEYLRERGISEDFAKRWGLRGGRGRYLFYVMVPVRDLDGNVVGFVGRDVTGRSEKRFLNSRGNLRRYLFGLYEAKDLIRRDGYVVLVEGIFDVLKGQQGGIPVVGLMGKVMSDEQLCELLQVTKRSDVVFVMLDVDAKKEAEELVKKLECFFDEVYVFELRGKKDLGDFTDVEVEELKRFIENYRLRMKVVL